jgi:hypothetical protein
MNGPPRVDIPTLKPDQLFDKRRQRDGARLKAYNKILEQIYGRIKTSSREGGDAYLVYNLPSFVLGIPLMDQQDLTTYIVYILRTQGYEVRFTYPNLLYISWKHHERDYILKNSPIMAAMLSAAPPAPPAATKPKGELRAQSGARVRFADQVQQGAGGPGIHVQQPQQRPMTMGRAPPRSTAEYQPPTSFLDALERPVAEPRKAALDDFLNF